MSKTGNFKSWHLLGAVGKVRTEKWQGRDHLVVPVVALVEGVIHAVNADDPEFVPGSVLKAARDSWNGMPTTLGHPMREGKAISANDSTLQEFLETKKFGIIRNSDFTDSKLGMEALIDIAKLEKLDPDLLEALQKGEHVEVSVGALVRTAKKEGSHKGKKYKGEWLEVYGDHLAFLPGGRGACSGEMGCGANRYLVTAEGFAESKSPQSLPFTYFGVLEGSSFEERMRAIELAVREKWPVKQDAKGNEVYPGGAWPMQNYDDHVIVNVYGATNEMFWCDYSMGDDGRVRLGEPKKVKQVYVTALGKRNSDKDVEIIQGVHDHMMAIGAKCDEKNCRHMEEQPATNDIRLEGKKWCVYSKDGKTVLGTHNTEADAVAHSKMMEEARQRRSAELAEKDKKKHCGCQATGSCACAHASIH